NVAGPREGPLAGVERAVLLVGRGDEDVVLVLGEIAGPHGGDRLPLVGAAVLRPAAESGELGAGEVLAQDEVHNTCDRIGAGDRRRAVLQDLDPVDRRQRYRVEVE